MVCKYFSARIYCASLQTKSSEFPDVLSPTLLTTSSVPVGIGHGFLFSMNLLVPLLVLTETNVSHPAQARPSSPSSSVRGCHRGKCLIHSLSLSAVSGLHLPKLCTWAHHSTWEGVPERGTWSPFVPFFKQRWVLLRNHCLTYNLFVLWSGWQLYWYIKRKAQSQQHPSWNPLIISQKENKKSKCNRKYWGDMQDFH